MFYISKFLCIVSRSGELVVYIWVRVYTVPVAMADKESCSLLSLLLKLGHHRAGDDLFDPLTELAMCSLVWAWPDHRVDAPRLCVHCISLVHEISLGYETV